jgi:MFS superfamily sulfate permease-like transporter
VYRFGADLFYANERRFGDEVRALVDRAPTPVRCLVVEAGAITDLDFSAARSLRELCEELKARGVELIFGRVSPSLSADMQRHGILDLVGPTRALPTLHEAIELAQAVSSRASAKGPEPRDETAAPATHP